MIAFASRLQLSPPFRVSSAAFDAQATPASRLIAAVSFFGGCAFAVTFICVFSGQPQLPPDDRAASDAVRRQAAAFFASLPSCRAASSSRHFARCRSRHAWHCRHIAYRQVRFSLPQTVYQSRHISAPAGNTIFTGCLMPLSAITKTAIVSLNIYGHFIVFEPYQNRQPRPAE